MVSSPESSADMMRTCPVMPLDPSGMMPCELTLAAGRVTRCAEAHDRDDMIVIRIGAALDVQGGDDRGAPVYFLLRPCQKCLELRRRAAVVPLIERQVQGAQDLLVVVSDQELLVLIAIDDSPRLELRDIAAVIQRRRLNRDFPAIAMQIIPLQPTRNREKSADCRRRHGRRSTSTLKELQRERGPDARYQLRGTVFPQAPAGPSTTSDDRHQCEPEA